MRVLQITTNYPTKENPAFGVFMKEQIESLLPFGVENTVFFSNGSETNIGKRNGGWKVHLRSVFKLQYHLLTHKKYDVIHCHSSLSGMILLLSGGVFFNKTIISFQNDPEQFIDKKYFRILYPFFNAIIVKKKTKYLQWKKVHYLPNGCDLKLFVPLDKDECKSKLGLEKTIDYILFVDSNTSRKRIQKRKDIFDNVLEIVRREYGHNVQELVLSNVKHQDVPIYINSCSLHLLTSDHEGSPNSVKECLSCGVPVVSTDVGNVRDILCNVPDCYVVSDADPYKIAEAVNDCMNGVRRGIRDAFLRKRLDMQSVAEALFAIYCDVSR